MRSKTIDSAADGTLPAGGLLAPFGAYPCCVLALALVLAGASGALIGNLTALAPYRPIFLALGTFLVGIGLWRNYGRWQPACEGASHATVAFRRWTKAGLWLAVVF